MNEKESKNSIQVIERMMRLLDILASRRRGEPQARVGKAELHPSTAHRILTALVRDRMVERMDQGSYRLGIRLLELGSLGEVADQTFAGARCRSCASSTRDRSGGRPLVPAEQ